MATSTQSPVLKFDHKGIDNDTLLQLYRAILLPRLIEEKMLILLRQNKISKWFSGIGQEAVSVGIVQALTEDDYIYPLHRNLGIFTGRNMPLHRLFAQWQGKLDGYTKGRDRSFHFGAPEHKVIGMISHLGAMLGVADGTSLASNLDGKDFISVAYSGDGGASEGDFHEALNVAAVWQLPVMFVIENNGYGLSTPSNEQFRCKQFTDKAIGYGIDAIQVDGNNILDVYRAAKKVSAQMRKDRKPILFEAMTFRMRGHEEASGTKYVPKNLMDHWATKDPVANYEQYLLGIGLLTEKMVTDIRKETKNLINKEWEKAMAGPDVAPTLAVEIGDVYPAMDYREVAPAGPETEKRLIDAISDGLRQSMEQYPELVLMGQDIAEYGGVFKITDGFVDQFGKGRVRNTPLCESAIIGCGFGLSLQGHRAMVEMQFADFVSCGFNQIVNNLAKNHYRWGHAPNVVVRMPTGAGVAAGPFHSQSNEAWFFHTPGLLVVYPSNPRDAKGLLNSALAYNGPAIFFEHKKMYRSVSGMVPDGYYTLPLGQAAIARPGSDATIVTYGMGVHWALQVADELGADVEVIDLRTLLPWDRDTVYASIRKTGKALVLHEDTLTGGIGGEIAACIAEELFQHLDGPVVRVGSLDTPVPFHADLENQFLPLQRLKERLEWLLGY